MGLCLGCERHCHSKHRCHDYEGYSYVLPDNCHVSTIPRRFYDAPTSQNYLSPPTNNHRGYSPQYSPQYSQQSIPIPYSNSNLPSRVSYTKT